MLREDLSEKLIHLTRDFAGKNGEERFLSILEQKQIDGTNTNNKGSYNCICFSEAPIASIGRIIARKGHSVSSNSKEIRYSPYGFMFSKEYLFKIGARPVLYQTKKEYELLPEDLKYKHVEFDLSKEKIVDWTWEREWRLKTDQLPLDPKNVTLIIPSRAVLEKIISDYQSRCRAVSSRAFGAFPQINWHFLVLEDLGFKI